MSSYTCPMHPEITSHNPGNCPKCGMALVPADEQSAHQGHLMGWAVSGFGLSRRVLIWLAVALAVFIGAELFNITPLLDSYIDYFKLIWWAVLLGLFLGGAIDYFVPDEFVYKYLGRHRLASLFYAVFGGFLMSACSHGILALAIQLYKKGASIPATVTFLLASPWASLPVTILLFGFFGPKAFWFIGGAMLIALITGLIFMGLEKAGLIEKSLPERAVKLYHWHRLKKFKLNEAAHGVLGGSAHLANMVLWWIIIGFLAAVFIRAYVPEEVFHAWLGPGVTGLLITLAVATVIEICSEGSAPLAFEIFSKVGSFGHPFVFLMAGVATDYTEIGLLWANIGKRTAIWLPIVAVPQIVVLGLLFNAYL